jgi:hypothetical protein
VKEQVETQTRKEVKAKRVIALKKDSVVLNGINATKARIRLKKSDNAG